MNCLFYECIKDYQLNDFQKYSDCFYKKKSDILNENVYH